MPGPVGKSPYEFRRRSKMNAMNRRRRRRRRRHRVAEVREHVNQSPQMRKAAHRESNRKSAVVGQEEDKNEASPERSDWNMRSMNTEAMKYGDGRRHGRHDQVRSR